MCFLYCFAVLRCVLLSFTVALHCLFLITIHISRNKWKTNKYRSVKCHFILSVPFNRNFTKILNIYSREMKTERMNVNARILNFNLESISNRWQHSPFSNLPFISTDSIFLPRVMIVNIFYWLLSSFEWFFSARKQFFTLKFIFNYSELIFFSSHASDTLLALFFCHLYLFFVFLKKMLFSDIKACK
jgi:hypothetical protein